MYKINTPEQIMPLETQIPVDLSNWISFDLRDPIVQQRLLIRAVETNNLNLVNSMLTWRKPGFRSWLGKLFGLPTPFSKLFVNVENVKSLVNSAKSPEMLDLFKSIKFPEWALTRHLCNMKSPYTSVNQLFIRESKQILKPLFGRMISENNENVLSWLIKQGYWWSSLSNKSLLRFTLDYHADKSLAIILNKKIHLTPQASYWGNREDNSCIEEIGDFLKNNLAHSHACIPVLLNYSNFLNKLLDGDNVNLFLTTPELKRKWIEVVDDTFSHLIPNNESFPVLTPEQAQQAYYYIAHLLRVDTDEADEKIKLLLSVPSVREIARTEVTKDRPDYLLHLARHFNNPTIADALLTITSVYENAGDISYLDRVRTYWPVPQISDPLVLPVLHQNHDDRYDRIEALFARMAYMQSEEGIREIVREVMNRIYDHFVTPSNTLELDTSTESSMRWLNDEENNQLSRFITYYMPKLEEAGGIAPVLKSLENELATAYNQKPAQYNKMNLPLEWTEWESSPLFKNPEAINAYYQHKIHTAWRYLQIPNPWFSSDATYFESVNMENGEVKRTGFYKNYLCTRQKFSHIVTH